MESKIPYDFLQPNEWHDIDNPGGVADINPVKLAYLGDAIYELAVRLYLIESYPGTLRNLHKKATGLVNAHSQSRVIHKLLDQLSVEELDIVRRGRNTKTNVPRSATVDEYRYSTALEALFGYLYLTGKRERLKELLHLSIEMLKDDAHSQDHGQSNE